MPPTIILASLCGLSGLVGALYRHQVREMVALAPAEMTADILAASDKMTGPVRGSTEN